MSTPKRHHHIPQMLLRNFLNSNKQLYFYDSKNPDKIEARNEETVAYVKRLYPHKLELEFSKKEGQAKTAIDKILSGVLLDEDTATVIISFLIALFLRAPKHVLNLSSEITKQRMTELLISEAKAYGYQTLPLEFIKSLIDNMYEGSFNKLWKIFSERAVDNFNIRLYVNFSGTPFILNDNYITIAPDHNLPTSLDTKNMEWMNYTSKIYCPLSATRCFVFVNKRDAANKGTTFVNYYSTGIAEAGVKAINELSARQASRYLYSTTEDEIARVKDLIST